MAKGIPAARLLRRLAWALTLTGVACGGPPQGSRAAGPRGSAALTGIVESREGKPLAQALVQLEYQGHTAFEAGTGPDGSFSFMGLGPADYNLKVSRGPEFIPFDFAVYNRQALRPENFPGGRYFLRVTLQTRPTVLTGRVVVEGTQAPIPGAAVGTIPATVQALTDQQGAFRLESEQFEGQEKYRVNATHADYNYQATETAAVRLYQENAVPDILMKPRDQIAPVKEGNVRPDPAIGIVAPAK
jgi:hypothetical protein